MLANAPSKSPIVVADPDAGRRVPDEDVAVARFGPGGPDQRRPRSDKKSRKDKPNPFVAFLLHKQKMIAEETGTNVSLDEVRVMVGDEWAAMDEDRRRPFLEASRSAGSPSPGGGRCSPKGAAKGRTTPSPPTSAAPLPPTEDGNKPALRRPSHKKVSFRPMQAEDVVRFMDEVAAKVSVDAKQPSSLAELSATLCQMNVRLKAQLTDLEKRLAENNRHQMARATQIDTQLAVIRATVKEQHDDLQSQLTSLSLTQKTAGGSPRSETASIGAASGGSPSATMKKRRIDKMDSIFADLKRFVEEYL